MKCAGLEGNIMEGVKSTQVIIEEEGGCTQDSSPGCSKDPTRLAVPSSAGCGRGCIPSHWGIGDLLEEGVLIGFRRLGMVCFVMP